MRLNTCYYVKMSDLHALSKEARDALNLFCDYDNNPYTFGNANRTLVHVPAFLKVLKAAVESSAEAKQGVVTIEQVLSKSYDAYVDLEN